jgi:lysophospholipase L1-like esterase
MKKLIKILAFVVITIVASVAIDRVIGLINRKDQAVGLLFPPHSRILYKTSEFNFTTTINALGFRDRDFTVAKGSSYRIIAIGDSFTYGWGVDVDQSWPKVLERNLNDNGLRVEIANLGRPGDGPINYADTAQRAIPLLKPDLVIVEALQGDDLAQSMPPQPKKAGASDNFPNLAGVISAIVDRMYPNIANLAIKAVVDSERDYPTVTNFKRDHPRIAGLITAMFHEQSVVTEWKNEQERILAQFNPEERRRYEALDEIVKHAFMTGGLNPALIEAAIKHRVSFSQTFDIDTPYVRFLIDEMAKQLSRIKKTSDQYKAKMVVVSLPFGIYVNQYTFETWRRYGFHVDREMLVSDSPDRAIRLACEKAGVSFFTVTDSFRRHEDSHFFYNLDGHFNAAGHQFYARRLTPIISETIKGHLQDHSPAGLAG